MKIEDVEIPDFLIDDINNVEIDNNIDDEEMDTKNVKKSRKNRRNILTYVEQIDKIEKIERLTYTTSFIKFFIEEFSERFLFHFNDKYYFLEIDYPDLNYIVKSEKFDIILKFIERYDEKVLKNLKSKYTISQDKEIGIKVLEPHIDKEYFKNNRKTLKHISLITGSNIDYYKITIKKLNYTKSFRKDKFKLEEIIKIRNEKLSEILC